MKNFLLKEDSDALLKEDGNHLGLESLSSIWGPKSKGSNVWTPKGKSSKTWTPKSKGSNVWTPKVKENC